MDRQMMPKPFKKDFMGEISSAVWSASIKVQCVIECLILVSSLGGKMVANSILLALEIQDLRVSVTIVAKFEKW